MITSYNGTNSLGICPAGGLDSLTQYAALSQVCYDSNNTLDSQSYFYNVSGRSDCQEEVQEEVQGEAQGSSTFSFKDRVVSFFQYLGRQASRVASTCEDIFFHTILRIPTTQAAPVVEKELDHYETEQNLDPEIVVQEIEEVSGAGDRSEQLQVVDISPQWELAERISGHAKLPEQALQAVFTGIMEGLEKFANMQFDPMMKNRVWDVVSKEKLQTIHNFFIKEFCAQILGKFKDREVQEMLEAHKKTGFIRDPMYSEDIQSAYFSKKQLIVDAVCKEADSMAHEWVPEVVEALYKEAVSTRDERVLQIIERAKREGVPLLIEANNS